MSDSVSCRSDPVAEMTFPHVRRDGSSSTRELLVLSGCEVIETPWLVYFLADAAPSQNATYWIENIATGDCDRACLQFASHDKTLDECTRDELLSCDAEMLDCSIWRIKCGDVCDTATPLDQQDSSKQVWKLVFVTDSGS